MKIGILTYHRTLNYGACLQAVATRVVLERMGHEVYYIDYWPKYHSRSYKPFSFDKLFSLTFKMAVKYVTDTIKNYRFRKKRIDNFEEFFKKYIYPYCRSYTEEYDVVIYGSDQIWRKQSALKSYDSIYFGKNDIKAKKHVAYSASMGILPQNAKDIDTIKELVSHLDNIAVREQDLKDFLESMGYKDITLSLDPTLLLTSEEWDEIIPTSAQNHEKYVLVYSINRVSFSMNEIYDFAKEHNCKVIILSGTASSLESDVYNTTANPSIFISLIKNAEYVFTSSFHGLAFSIIYHKEFFGSYRQNSNRAQTLLDSLKIKGRITTGSDLPDTSIDIDYSKVQEKLDILKQISIDYLKDSIV